MDITCYTFLYIPLHHYPWCSGLRPRPCCISCRQNIYFCLIRRLIRQKYHFSVAGNLNVLSFEIHSTLYFSMIINLTSTKSSYNGSSKKTISRIYFKFFTLRSYSNKHSCTKDRVTRFECSPLQKNGKTKTSVQDRFFKKSLIAMLAFSRLEEVVVNTAN